MGESYVSRAKLQPFRKQHNGAKNDTVKVNETTSVHVCLFQASLLRFRFYFQLEYRTVNWYSHLKFRCFPSTFGKFAPLLDYWTFFFVVLFFFSSFFFNELIWAKPHTQTIAIIIETPKTATFFIFFFDRCLHSFIRSIFVASVQHTQSLHCTDSMY